MSTLRMELPIRTLRLVATARGFHNGAIVERGDTFTWTGRRSPSWAIPAGRPLPPIPHADFDGDTKPKAAKEAARAYQRTHGIGGQL